MATAVITSTTGKVTWPWVGVSGFGFTVDVQHTVYEPEELN